MSSPALYHHDSDVVRLNTTTANNNNNTLSSSSSSSADKNKSKRSSRRRLLMTEQQRHTFHLKQKYKIHPQQYKQQLLLCPTLSGYSNHDTNKKIKDKRKENSDSAQNRLHTSNRNSINFHINNDVITIVSFAGDDDPSPLPPETIEGETTTATPIKAIRKEHSLNHPLLMATPSTQAATTTTATVTAATTVVPTPPQRSHIRKEKSKELNSVDAVVQYNDIIPMASHNISRTENETKKQKKKKKKKRRSNKKTKIKQELQQGEDNRRANEDAFAFSNFDDNCNGRIKNNEDQNFIEEGDTTTQNKNHTICVTADTKEIENQKEELKQGNCSEHEDQQSPAEETKAEDACNKGENNAVHKDRSILVGTRTNGTKWHLIIDTPLSHKSYNEEEEMEIITVQSPSSNDNNNTVKDDDNHEDADNLSVSDDSVNDDEDCGNNVKSLRGGTILVQPSEDDETILQRTEEMIQNDEDEVFGIVLVPPSSSTEQQQHHQRKRGTGTGKCSHDRNETLPTIGIEGILNNNWDETDSSANKGNNKARSNSLDSGNFCNTDDINNLHIVLDDDNVSYAITGENIVYIANEVQDTDTVLHNNKIKPPIIISSPTLKKSRSFNSYEHYQTYDGTNVIVDFPRTRRQKLMLMTRKAIRKQLGTEVIRAYEGLDCDTFNYEANREQITSKKYAIDKIRNSCDKIIHKTMCLKAILPICILPCRNSKSNNVCNANHNNSNR